MHEIVDPGHSNPDCREPRIVISWTSIRQNSQTDVYTETEISSFQRNYHHCVHRKLPIWQLPVQPVANISSKWRYFVSVYTMSIWRPLPSEVLCVKATSRSSRWSLDAELPSGPVSRGQGPVRCPHGGPPGEPTAPPVLPSPGGPDAGESSSLFH